MRDLPVYTRIQKELSVRLDEGHFRKTPPAHAWRIDCSTNSYLSLEHEPAVIAATRQLLGDSLAGNRASRLIASSTDVYDTLETEIAEWKNAEACLVFNSGYAANVGTIQALCNRDTEVYCDRLNHASIYDGIALSGAKLIRYKHCNMADLQARLSASTAREKIIVTDTVFSMDGDVAPLSDICELAQTYECMVIIDEAHATGMFGPTLAGAAERLASSERKLIDITIGTMSKAIAGTGGFFTGNSTIRSYLVNTARSQIFSTGLPHAALAWNLAAIQHVRAHPTMSVDVLHRAEVLREKLAFAGFDTNQSTSQIVPIIIGNAEDALSLSNDYAQAGIRIPAIRTPTVPKGTERLRISVHRLLTNDNVHEMLHILKKWNLPHAK